jgi:hypothetical protein
MAIEEPPIVSQWYRHRDKGYEFQVLSIDEDEATLEVQHFDGDVEELDLDGWYELDIEPIEAPEDWTGPMDDVERDDLGYTETDMDQEDWESPLREEGHEERRENNERKDGGEE